MALFCINRYRLPWVLPFSRLGPARPRELRPGVLPRPRIELGGLGRLCLRRLLSGLFQVRRGGGAGGGRGRGAGSGPAGAAAAAGEGPAAEEAAAGGAARGRGRGSPRRSRPRRRGAEPRGRTWGRGKEEEGGERRAGRCAAAEEAKEESRAWPLF